jgi:F-type H+-transporting ATPase subunit b
LKSCFRFSGPRLLTLILLLTFSGVSGLTACALAQDASQPAASAARETATSDEQGGQDAFRHAAPVRWIARQLHVNVETAAKGIEDFNSGVLIVVILVFVARKLPAAFRKSRQEIGTALVDARTATEQANERLKVVEDRLSRLDDDIAGIRAQAALDGAQDEVRIKQSLEEERKRIVESAEQEIASAGTAAQRKLKQFAAELAIDRATRDLRLTPEADRVLVSEFGKQLSSDRSDLGRGGRN